jgi:hypothetical protein
VVLRTTGGVVAEFESAARLGEAASMAKAIRKQIYTFLFDSTIWLDVANIIS